MSSLRLRRVAAQRRGDAFGQFGAFGRRQRGGDARRVHRPPERDRHRELAFALDDFAQAVAHQLAPALHQLLVIDIELGQHLAGQFRRRAQERARFLRRARAPERLLGRRFAGARHRRGRGRAPIAHRHAPGAVAPEQLVETRAVEIRHGLFGRFAASRTRREVPRPRGTPGRPRGWWPRPRCGRAARPGCAPRQGSPPGGKCSLRGLSPFSTGPPPTSPCHRGRPS